MGWFGGGNEAALVRMQALVDELQQNSAAVTKVLDVLTGADDAAGAAQAALDLRSAVARRSSHMDHVDVQVTGLRAR